MRKLKSIFHIMIYNKWTLALTVCMEVYFMYYFITIHWSIFPMIFALPLYVYANNHSNMAASAEISFKTAASLVELPINEEQLQKIQENRIRCKEKKKLADAIYWGCMVLFAILYFCFNSPFN